MKIIRIINNNVVSSVDDKGKEIVIMGKGIGFRKKSGEFIDDQAIEKIFHLPSENMTQFEELLENMPYEHIKAAKDIIVYARKQLDRHLNKNIYITLTDHLSYAIERQKQNMNVQNALLWEIKKYYHEEYLVGLHALDIIKEQLDIQLPEDEAGFIALHFVNAEMDGDMNSSARIPILIKDIINIVKYSFNIEINEETFVYERFMMHLKFLVQRAVNEDVYDPDNLELEKCIKAKCRKEYSCACKIKKYIESKCIYNVSEEETAYIALHINRVVRNSI